MRRVNKIRTSVREAAKEELRRSGSYFSIPCPKCHKPLHFQSDQPDWNTATLPKLLQAFGQHSPTKCT